VFAVAKRSWKYELFTIEFIATNAVPHPLCLGREVFSIFIANTRDELFPFDNIDTEFL
jgi:hypothetical protein